VFAVCVATRAVIVKNATQLHAGGRSLRTARVRSDAGISLALYIVVRCNAHSIKLLRREVRICAMFQNVERRLVEV
jgi:hypothetical protein